MVPTSTTQVGNPTPTDNSASATKSTPSKDSSRTPPDPDPDPEGDGDKKKQYKQIDDKRKGQFLIDSDYLTNFKGRGRGNMKCEVERYERGTDLTIQDWIKQMETYFTVGQVPPEAFVGFMMMKIVPKHLNEIKEFQNLDYLMFREKLIEVFKEPDMATAYLNALSNINQERDESIPDYMYRVRLLVLKAHPDLSFAARERILVTSFLLGLHDRQLASSLAVAKIDSAAEAQRLAAEGDSVRRERRSRSSGNYLLTSTHRSSRTSMAEGERDSEEEGEEDEDEDDPEYDDEVAAALAEAQPRRSSSTSTRVGKREVPSTSKCYSCGQPGHYRADCPRRSRVGTSRRLQPVQIECRLCGEHHFVRECPQLEAAKRLLKQEASAKTDTKTNAARTSTVSDSSVNFKKDGTAVIFETEDSPVQVCDPALPMSDESTPGNPRMALFFVMGAVQTLPTWILADSGSVRNLIDEQVYKRLPFQPPIRSPGDCRVIGGNGEPLDLKGFAVLPVTLGDTLLWHEFGVVPDLPLEVLVGADILATHQCSLLYLTNNQKRLQFGKEVCTSCDKFRTDPEVGEAVQLKFVERTPRRRRNRLRLSSNFVATLPEVEEPIRERASQTPTEPADSANPDGDVATPVTTEPATPTNLDGEAAPQIGKLQEVQPIQTGKLQKVLADLRVAALPLSEEIRRRVVAVVKANLDAFAGSPTDLGRTSVVVHTIKTAADAKPFRHKLRPIPFARRQYLEQEVAKLLAIGAISEADPGACPYASRTVIAPKKDGTLRMCVDYRDINAQTEKDAYPLPRIDTVWATLAKAKYFAALDLIMGYHQVEVDSKDRFKTAFLTHKGLYTYNVMPFGLCNAPATFQRLMEKILGKLVGHGVLVYLDDVLIYAETPTQLLDMLSQVLRLLADAGLKCKGSKCFLFTEQVHYLGHIVSNNGINPEPAKIEKIRNWPAPEKGIGLASFLGLCNYYRELIPNFAHVSDPLYKASKTEFIEWTPTLTESFNNLKQLLTEPRVVRLPNPDNEFVLETDASRVALGAVLKQKFVDTNLEHPVGFFSRALTGSERNYVAYELELYAVVRAVEHFRMFLLGREFLLRTDHAALRNLLRRDLPPTTRVERWILRLSEYTFRIEYQRGQDNVLADILSRLPFASAELSRTSTSPTLTDEVHETSPTSTIEVHNETNIPPDAINLELSNSNLEHLRNIIDNEQQSSEQERESDSSDSSDEEDEMIDDDTPITNPCNALATSMPFVDLPISREGLEPEDFTIPTREEFIEAQKRDIEIEQLRNWVESHHPPSTDDVAPMSNRMKALTQLFDELRLADGLLVIRRHDDPERELVIVPDACVERLIRFYHEGPGSAHQAAKSTSARIIRLFWWPDLKRDVRLYIACCPTCERFFKLNKTPKAGLRSMEVGGRGDCLALDVVGGKDSLPQTPRGHRYILSIIDCFTRFAVAVPIIDQSTDTIISALLGSYLTVYGTPRRILTDQGRCFESEQFASFCNLFRIFKITNNFISPSI